MKSRLVSGWLMGVVLSGSLTAAEPATNVLLITVDTLRPDALGWVSGNGWTPNLDRLASSGFRFPTAVSPVPLTLPSHITILSGLLPRHHGVRDNGQVLSSSSNLLPEILAGSGRRTAAFVGGFPLLRRFGVDRGFQHYDDDLSEGPEGWLERDAEETTLRAVEWIASQDAPWFVWVHYYDPHDPYEPPRAHWKPGPRGAYDGEVSWVDSNVGRLLDAIDPSQTLSIFTADHAESLGEHDESTHGYFVYDSTLLVPLVFAWPGHIPPGESALSARLSDVTPTVLDLLGIPAAVTAVDGASLVPVFHGELSTGPPAYFETHQPWLSYGWSPLKGLRHDGWKLIVAPSPELYDLSRDPGEMTNLYATDRPQATALLRRMRQIEERPEVSSILDDDPEVLEALTALGYLAGRRPSAPPRGKLDDPKDRLATRNRLARGEALLRSNELAAARTQFEAVLAEEPDNRFAALRAGIAALKSDQLETAVTHLKRAIQLDPDQAESRFALADALTRLGSYEAAVDQWFETVRLQPRRVAAWSNLGFVLGRVGRLPQAVAALEKAVELDPENPQPRTGLATAARGLGNHELALEQLLAVEGLTETFQHNALLGLLLLHDRRPQEALSRLRRATPGEPEYLRSQLELARIYLVNGAEAAAASLVKKLAEASEEGSAAVLEDPRLAALLKASIEPHQRK